MIVKISHYYGSGVLFKNSYKKIKIPLRKPVKSFLYMPVVEANPYYY